MTYSVLTGTLHYDCDIEVFEARSDTKANFMDAYLMKVALESPDIPARSESVICHDRNGKPMLAYFGDDHGVPESILRRKHYHTQLLFHQQPKPITKQANADNRHLGDITDPVFQYTVEGDETVHCEAKGLRHDVQAWFERGHSHDVSVLCKFWIFVTKYIYCRGPWSHRKI